MNRQEFIELLIEQRDWSNSPYCDRILDIKNGAECTNPSAIIDHLKSMPFRKNEDPVTEIGIYRNSAGDVYKVNCSKNTGRLYAIILYRNSDGTYSWNYEQTPKGAIHKLHSADKLVMSLEEAREFGATFNYCGICGRELNNPISVKLGIGPVCGNREYGEEFKLIEKEARILIEKETGNSAVPF